MGFFPPKKLSLMTMFCYGHVITYTVTGTLFSNMLFVTIGKKDELKVFIAKEAGYSRHQNLNGSVVGKKAPATGIYLQAKEDCKENTFEDFHRYSQDEGCSWSLKSRYADLTKFLVLKHSCTSPWQSCSSVVQSPFQVKVNFAFVWKIKLSHLWGKV